MIYSVFTRPFRRAVNAIGTACRAYKCKRREARNAAEEKQRRLPQLQCAIDTNEIALVCERESLADELEQISVEMKQTRVQRQAIYRSKALEHFGMSFALDFIDAAAAVTPHVPTERSAISIAVENVDGEHEHQLLAASEQHESISSRNESMDSATLNNDDAELSGRCQQHSASPQNDLLTRLAYLRSSIEYDVEEEDDDEDEDEDEDEEEEEQCVERTGTTPTASPPPPPPLPAGNGAVKPATACAGRVRVNELHNAIHNFNTCRSLNRVSCDQLRPKELLNRDRPLSHSLASRLESLRMSYQSSDSDAANVFDNDDDVEWDD